MPFHPEQPDPDHDRVSLTEEQKLIFRSCIPLVEESDFSPADDFWDEVRAKEDLIHRNNPFKTSCSRPGVDAEKFWETDSRIGGDRFTATAYSAWHDMARTPLIGTRHCVLARFMLSDMLGGRSAMAMVYQVNLRRERIRVFPILTQINRFNITLSNDGGLYDARERAKKFGFNLKPRVEDAELVLEQLTLGAYGSSKL